MDALQYSHLGYFIAGLLITGLLALYQFLKDHTVKSVWFVFFAILFLLVLLFGTISTLDDINSPKDKIGEIVKPVNEHADSLNQKLDSPVKQIQSGVDSLLKKTQVAPIIKIPQQENREYSELKVCPVSNIQNPILTSDKSQDTLWFVLKLCNSGNIEITNLVDKIRFVNILNNDVQLNDTKLLFPAFNKYSKITPGDLKVLEVGAATLPISSHQGQDFIFIKINYRDKIKKDSLIMAYAIGPNFIRKPLRFANSQEMNFIEIFLRKNKLW